MTKDNNLIKHPRPITTPAVLHFMLVSVVHLFADAGNATVVMVAIVVEAAAPLHCMLVSVVCLFAAVGTTTVAFVATVAEAVAPLVQDDGYVCGGLYNENLKT